MTAQDRVRDWKKLLIIDDESSVREAVGRMFAGTGIAVLAAEAQSLIDESRSICVGTVRDRVSNR